MSTVTTTILTTTPVNETWTNQCTVPRGRVLELWATRILCGVLGLGLIGLLALHVKSTRYIHYEEAANVRRNNYG